ncbi:HAMP domain-containing histidine kinase [Parabacteroides sp. OttesenSCG-928-G21]|nr:HAMP domain-containing histidine kinase [Parabacteroides sp. OttesenSCG-928-G21]
MDCEQKVLNRFSHKQVEGIHEVQTLVNEVLELSFLLTEKNQSEENQYYIQLIQRNRDLLQKLNTGLKSTTITINKVKSAVGKFDIKELCHSAINLKSANRKDYIKLLFDQHLPSIFVETDSDRVIQVLYLLLDNAYKYTNEGSITLSYRLEEDSVRVEVADTGIGFTEQEMASIFPVNGSNARSGLCTGLRISNKIIQELGGKTGLKSIEGKGTSFWFVLPIQSK